MWVLAFVFLTGGTVRSLPASAADGLHVEVTGSGQPVVLIPGLFGSAFGFRKVVPLLTAAGFRAIVIEPLGLGSSARPADGDYSLTAQADRIARVLDTLAVRGVIVVAHSLGASMAYRLAYRHQALVRGIVSLEGGPAEEAATPRFRRAMRFAPWSKWCRRRTSTRCEPRCHPSRSTAFPEAVTTSTKSSPRQCSPPSSRFP